MNDYNPKCNECYWGRRCRALIDCDNHTPLVSDIDNDEYACTLEAEHRETFYKDWNDYLEGFDN